ncbi:MAG: gliding motility lipoprotein GldJ, partial [Bacteroidetes bacterium]|nr:gliding motility lipoprotein GldJ [Bacteroidota bacterium]
MNRLKPFFIACGVSVLVSSCFLKKSGNPTAQDPGAVSTATGLKYYRDKAEGFAVTPYHSQPDAP